MLDTYIVDGEKTEIIILRKTFSTELLEVTSFSDACRNYINSGVRFLNIVGKYVNEEEVFDKTFRVIDKKEDMFYLTSIVN